MTETEIPNIWIRFAEKNWHASLDFQQTMNLLWVIPFMERAAKGPQPDQTIAEEKKKIEALVTLIFEALLRFHPDLTKDALEELLSVDAVGSIAMEIMKMVFHAYSDREEERRPYHGGRPNLRLLINNPTKPEG